MKTHDNYTDVLPSDGYATFIWKLLFTWSSKWMSAAFGRLLLLFAKVPFTVHVFISSSNCSQVTLAESLNDIPKITGSRYDCLCCFMMLHVHVCILFLSPSLSLSSFRYRVSVEIPVQRTLFRVLPTTLQEGKEVDVFVVLFTQGINEQQTLADRYSGVL